MAFLIPTVTHHAEGVVKPTVIAGLAVSDSDDLGNQAYPWRCR
jgi:hypothetical protein